LESESIDHFIWRKGGIFVFATLFGFIFAVIVETYIIYNAIKHNSILLTIFAVIQGLNVIWQFLGVVGLLP